MPRKCGLNLCRSRIRSFPLTALTSAAAAEHAFHENILHEPEIIRSSVYGEQHDIRYNDAYQKSDHEGRYTFVIEIGRASCRERV